MNGYPPGFLERHIPGLRTPQSRAYQRDALLRGARSLDPNAMDTACARGASMNAEVIDTMVVAAGRGQFHPFRMVECIRCAVRWNADLLRPSRNGTSAVVNLLKSIESNKMALTQAERLVERRWHGCAARVEGRVMPLHEAMAGIGSRETTPPAEDGVAIDQTAPARAAPKP